VSLRLTSEVWRRWAAGIGLLFAATGPPFGFTPGHVFTISGVNTYGAGTSPAVISGYAASHRGLLGFDLLGECVLALSLVCFAALLRRLGRPGEGADTIGLVGFGMSIVSACMVFVAVACGIAIVELAPASDYGTISALWFLAHGVALTAALPFAVLMGATGVVIVNQGSLPAWIGWFSLLLSALIFLEGLNVAVQATTYATSWPFQAGSLPATSSIWAFAMSLALLLERRRASTAT